MSDLNGFESDSKFIAFKQDYENFILTKNGVSWVNDCKRRGMSGDFEDYLYNFCPEQL